MKGKDYTFYTEITQLGSQARGWKTESAQMSVEVCGPVPENCFQPIKLLARLPEGQISNKGGRDDESVHCRT